MREITFVKAINEALHQILEAQDSAFLIGQGVISPWYVGSTTIGLLDKYGPERVIDTPVSEGAITGAAVGAALAGMRPIVEHPRLDFMYLAMDQIINQAANWYYMFGHQVNVPMVIWGIINRGGEQAAQHSQALQAMYAHVPGLKVVMPATPYDAKGLLYSSVMDDNPVLYIDERWLYDQSGPVPEELYEVPIGKGEIRRSGKDVTVIASSYMVVEAMEAAEKLQGDGIDVEVLDLRTIKPLDEELIMESVGRTGRAVVADGGWKSFGISAEVSAVIMENAFDYLKAPVLRVALPDSPAPASRKLEDAYYPTSDNIIEAVKKALS